MVCYKAHMSFTVVADMCYVIPPASQCGTLRMPLGSYELHRTADQQSENSLLLLTQHCQRCHGGHVVLREGLSLLQAWADPGPFGLTWASD